MKTIKLKELALAAGVFAFMLTLFFLSRVAGRPAAVPEISGRAATVIDKEENNDIGKNAAKTGAGLRKKSKGTEKPVQRRKKRVSSLQEPGEAFGGGEKGKGKI